MNSLDDRERRIVIKMTIAWLAFFLITIVVYLFGGK